MMAERPLETFITLILEEEDAGLAQAHRELYPERIPEHIPLSLTLLYPWIPAESVKQADIEQLRAFFASRPALDFHLTRLAEFPGKVVYAVPESDGKLRATMRALWALYPEYPSYGEPGGDPPPHCTLGRLEGDYAITLEQAAASYKANREVVAGPCVSVPGRSLRRSSRLSAGGCAETASAA